VDGQKALVYPLGPAVYVTTPGVDQAAQTLLGQADTAQVEQVGAPGGESYGIFRRSNESRDDVLAGKTPLGSPRRLANGVELLAWRFDGELRPGGTIQFSLAWWLDGPPPAGTDYHFFAHLVDAAGQRWGQHDQAGFPTASWQAGDLVLLFFQIEVGAEAPAGEYWVNLGMYSYPDVVAVPVVDEAGAPVADWVVVGPVTLR
jgi:hypothetical protein